MRLYKQAHPSLVGQGKPLFYLLRWASISQLQQKTKGLQSKMKECLVTPAWDSMEGLVSVPQKAPWARVAQWVLIPVGRLSHHSGERVQMGTEWAVLTEALCQSVLCDSHTS